MNFAYTYDNRGNIISETRNGVITTYEYDELGQLIRVNDPNDPSADSVHGTTWIITYDRGGNILQKLAYVLTSDAQPSELRQSLIYEYTDANWKDKLTVFCNDEREYDAIGNLTDDGQWTYTWEKGRQLKSMHNPYTGVTMEFRYNHEGIRTQKVKKVNGVVTETTDYILKGKQIAAMKKNTDEYYFTYDASGKPATVNFNGANYTYIKNLQGDIVGILDASGNLVVEYKYDAWGDAVSIYSASTTVDNLAFDNPFRYRGYVWDEEIGLYYLRSRYYNPELGRFLNGDILLGGVGALFSHNQFAYCKNESIKHDDCDGNESTTIEEQYSPIYYTKEYNGKNYEYMKYYVPPREVSYEWVARAVDIGIAAVALVFTITAVPTTSQFVARATKKVLGKALVTNAKTAVVSDGLALVSELLDFSVGDLVVSGLDVALGKNANDGIYTTSGYWVEVPMEPMPCPAPTITPSPTPAPTPAPVPGFTPNPYLP